MRRTNTYLSKLLDYNIQVKTPSEGFKPPLLVFVPIQENNRQDNTRKNGSKTIEEAVKALAVVLENIDKSAE